jgi:hypothetical protein
MSGFEAYIPAIIGAGAQIAQPLLAGGQNRPPSAVSEPPRGGQGVQTPQPMQVPMLGGAGQPDPMAVLLGIMAQLSQQMPQGQSVGNQWAAQNPQAAQGLAVQNYPSTFGRMGLGF